MAQAELTVGIKLKPAAIAKLIPAICATTGQAEPVGEVTGPQMKVLILGLLRATNARYERETSAIPPLEGIE